MNPIILSALSLFLIVIGAAMSVLRSKATIEYMRTLLKDGRNAPQAKTQLVFYKIGKTLLIIGVLLLAYSLYLMLTK